MRRVFLHQLDGELARLAGRAQAFRFADGSLKLLALLGAQVSIGDVMPIDSGILLVEFGNDEFLRFITEVDRKFLWLDAGEDDSHDRWDRATTGLRRALAPDWVTSSTLPTSLITTFAESFTRGSTTDEVLAAVERNAPQRINVLDRRERLRRMDLVLRWFAEGKGQVQKPRARPPGRSYYQVLLELQDDVVGNDAATLDRVLGYLDAHVHPFDTVDPATYKRSAVIKATRRDQQTNDRAKAEALATVAMAWCATVAERSSASMAAMQRLDLGLEVPRLLSPPTEVFTAASSMPRILRRFGAEAAATALPLPPLGLSWEKVNEAVIKTKKSRRKLQEADDESYPDRLRDHVEELSRHFGRSTELVQLAIPHVVDVIAKGAPWSIPIRIAADKVAAGIPKYVPTTVTMRIRGGAKAMGRVLAP